MKTAIIIALFFLLPAKVFGSLWGREFSADELTALLRQKNDGEVDDHENGYSYAFLNISVGVYREAGPEDIAEMIEEMKADGIPTEDNEDLAADIKRANHWATIGIGGAGYYNNIADLRKV